MPVQSSPLQHMLQARLPPPRTRSPLAPGMVGLAVPVAALSVVLFGVDLAAFGLFGWVAAVLLVALALSARAAAALTVALTVAGLLLFRVMTDGAAIFAPVEYLALALLTALAWLAGQLLVLGAAQRAELRDRAGAVGIYDALLKSMFEGSADCVKLIAADGTVLAINAAGAAMLGAGNAAQVVGQNWFEFWDGDQRTGLVAACTRAREQGPAEFIGPCRTLTGARRIWRNTLIAAPLPGRTERYLWCLSRDITEISAAQEDLKTNNTRLSGLLHSIDDCFLAIDNRWSIIFINPQAAQLLLQESSGRLLGSNLWQVLPMSETDDATVCLRRAMQQQSVEKCLYYHASQQTWFSITAFPHPGGISVLARDITFLVNAEKRAEEEAARLQVAQDIAGFADWSFDYRVGVLTLSPQALALLELAPCDPADHKRRLLERLHAQDRMALIQAIINGPSDGAVLDISVRLEAVDSGGQLRHLHWVGRPVTDAQGAVTRMLGAVHDVTAHRSEQETQQQMQALVRGIIDALPQSICVIDHSGTMVTVNRAWQESWLEHFNVAVPSNNFFALSTGLHSDNPAALRAIARGINDVIAGRADHFEMEYDMPGLGHWYTVHATPLVVAGRALVVLSYENVTATRRLRDDAAENEHRLARAMGATNDGVWEWAPGGATFYSERCAELLGQPVGQLPRFDELLATLVHPEQRAQVQAVLDTSRADLCGVPFDVEVRMLSGAAYRWFRLRGIAECDTQQRVLRYSGALMDIQAEKDLQRAVRDRDEQLRELAGHISEVFWSFDIGTQRLTYVSPAVEQLHGISVAETLRDSQQVMARIHADDVEAVRAHFLSRQRNNESDYIEYRTLGADAAIRWIGERNYPVFDAGGRILRLVGLSQDITERKNYEQQLFRAAHYDELTGLANRKTLVRMLADKCAAGAAEFAVLLIDLDRFKNVNDSLGHSVGDALLVQVAARMRAVIGAGGELARLSGDEFAVLVPGAPPPPLLDAIMQGFARPFAMDNEQAFVTASMGIALYPQDGVDPDTLLKQADVAMYRAKQAGRNNCQFFLPHMALPSRAHLDLENELRTALQRSEFELFYQGKYDLNSGALVGAEALLRWRSQKRGLVAPAQFIPLLEETGLILPVGEWILAEACRQVGNWFERSGQWLPVAVNVSAIQIASRSFGDAAIAILRGGNIPAGVIELELTESALMTDVGHAAQLLTTLKAAGFTIALDDFGTGYSSLSYLRKFAPDTLKLDRSFVAELAEQVNDLAIVSGIVQLAKALDIKVIAEGIETVEQQRILSRIDCTLGQGFLFCRPLPAVEFEQAMAFPALLRLGTVE